MGRSLDSQQIKLRYKITSSIRQDNTNEQQMTTQLNQLNQNLTEMVNIMEELSNQLDEYVRTLTENIERFHQMLRPIQVSQASSRLRLHNEEEIEQMRNELIQLERETTHEFSRVINQLQNIEPETYRRAIEVFGQSQVQIQEQNITQIIVAQIPQEKQSSFFQRAYAFCSSQIQSFVEIVTLSS